MRQTKAIILLTLLLLLTACAKQSADPVVVKTPELGAMSAHTDQVAIIFKFYDESGQVEQSSCDFQWSAAKRMVGKCSQLAPGIYQYKLEYRDKSTSTLLAQANGSVNIGQDNDVFILPVIEFNQANLTAFVARINGNAVSTVAKPQMVLIPGGEFQMGDERFTDGVTAGLGLEFSDEAPVHRVTIASFELGKYEVRFAEYDEYLKSKGVDTSNSNITGLSDDGYDWGWGRGSRPVVGVSWDDIQGYLNWFNTEQGIALDDPKRYRLPSEAEWEYAARAGTTTAYSTGDCINTSQANYDNVGWDYSKSDGEMVLVIVSCPKTNLSREQTELVGQFAANSFGLYDMHGNVWEWVEDCWHSSYTDAPSDGSAWLDKGLGDCSARVMRGGSWAINPMNLRSAARLKFLTDFRWDNLGFRLASSLTLCPSSLLSFIISAGKQIYVARRTRADTQVCPYIQF